MICISPAHFMIGITKMNNITQIKYIFNIRDNTIVMIYYHSNGSRDKYAEKLYSKSIDWEYLDRRAKELLGEYHMEEIPDFDKITRIYRGMNKNGT